MCLYYVAALVNYYLATPAVHVNSYCPFYSIFANEIAKHVIHELSQLLKPPISYAFEQCFEMKPVIYIGYAQSFGSLNMLCGNVQVT